MAMIALAAVMTVAGCHKKEAPPPPPPPPPPAPTASLSANPESVTPGASSQLTWSTQNATDVTLEGIGKVAANGSQAVTPPASTTYRLIAKGPGGQQEATARVTVTASPPSPPPEVTPSDEELFARSVQDVFFDYDSFQLRPEAQQQLAADAQFLNQKPNLRFLIEGHCDERGSIEYNLTLGDSRANAARQALAQLGVSESRMRVISYGKEKPFCTESSEACWQQNRRAHFVLQK